MKATILHGSNDLYGASRVLLDEVESLQRVGYRVVVVVPSEGPLEAQVTALGAQLVVDRDLLVLRASKVRDVLHRPALPIDARNADLVVLWTLAMVPYIPLLGMARKHFYLAVHELLDNLQGRALLRTLVAPFKFPITACSYATRDWLIASGVSDSRVSVTYPIHRPTTTRPSRALTVRRTVAVLARVNGRKGHREVAEAFSSVAPSDWRLVLAGAPFEGQEAALDELKQSIQADARISYMGEVAGLESLGDDIALVACFPSRPEPFGLVPVEAWELGIPSIGYGDGGAAEALKMVGGVALARDGDPVEVISRGLRDWFAAGPPGQFPADASEVYARLSADRRTRELRQLLGGPTKTAIHG